MSELEKFTGNTSLIEGNFSFNINKHTGIVTVFSTEDGVELEPYISYAPFSQKVSLTDLKNIGYLISDYLSSKRKVN